MKKLSLLLAAVVLAVSFTGCKKQITTYSFGPQENEAEISQEHKDFLQTQLESAPKAPEGLSFYGYSASYGDDGSFTVLGFFRNNTGKPVHNISGTISVESVASDGESYLTIAKAKFEMSDDEFGTLPNGEARPWQLNFSSDLVVNKINDLSKYIVNTDLTYDTESSLKKSSSSSSETDTQSSEDDGSVPEASSDDNSQEE